MRIRATFAAVALTGAALFGAAGVASATPHDNGGMSTDFDSDNDSAVHSSYESEHENQNQNISRSFNSFASFGHMVMD